MVDLREEIEILKQISEEFSAELDPDDDWTPMLFIIYEGKRAAVSFEMPENGEKREHLFTVFLPNLIHEKFPNPDAIIFLTSVWYAVGFDPEGPPPSQLPDRKEALLLQGISKDEELMAMGEIIRSESHPELEWNEDVESTDEFAGRIMTFLRRAVWS